jgi:hypothetical protein
VKSFRLKGVFHRAAASRSRLGSYDHTLLVIGAAAVVVMLLMTKK